MSLIIKHCYFIQIDEWLNRLNIFDGADDMSMLIGEVYGNSNHRLLRSISSTGKNLFIDFKKENDVGNVEIIALIKYKKMDSVCQTWLNLKDNILMSQNSSNINCTWLITQSIGSYITIDFTFFEVS